MSTSLNIAKPGRVIHVGIVLMNGVTELLDVAPIDLLNSFSRRHRDWPDSFCPPDVKADALEMEFHWVNELGTPARLTSGLRVQPTDNFETCPRLDIIIMGAHFQTYRANERELAFVRKCYDECSAFITVCGGFRAPMQAGLLRGKKATAPRGLLAALRKDHPETEWVEKRWCRDGKLWTSGALLNGMELIQNFGEQEFPDNKALLWALKVGDWQKRGDDYPPASS